MIDAGVIPRGTKTLATHEALIDSRYPDYRSAVTEFLESGALERLQRRALRSIIKDAAARYGYAIEVSWLKRRPSHDAVRCVVKPDGSQPLVTAGFRGFTSEVPVRDGEGVARSIESFMGFPPLAVRVYEPGAVSAEIADAFTSSGARVSRVLSYPERV